MLISLSVIDRIMLPGIMPKSGNLLQMTSVKTLLKKTEVTKEEAATISLQFDRETNMTTWDPNRIPEPKNFDFTDAEIVLLRAAAESADRQGLVTLQTIDLINKLKR
jgi:hypothetical protein